MWVVDSPSPTLWSSEDMNAAYPHLMGTCAPLKQPNLGNQLNSLQCCCRLLKAKIKLFLFVYVEINGNDDVIIIRATEASDWQLNIHLCGKPRLCDENGCKEKIVLALETWLWAQPEPSNCHPLKSKSISKQTAPWFHYIYLWHNTILLTCVGFFSFLITALVLFTCKTLFCREPKV